MLVRRRVGDEHFLHAVEFCSRVGHGFAVFPGNKHVHVTAKRLGCRERFGGRILQRSVVMLGEKKRRHESTPASSLSLPTSSATEPTLTPDLRPGGSLVFTTCKRGLTSTPYDSGVFSSI